MRCGGDEHPCRQARAGTAATARRRTRRSRHRRPARRPGRRAPSATTRLRATGPTLATMPAELEAGNVRRAGRRRILALPLHQVGPVDAGRMHADANLVQAGLRHRPLDRAQHFGAAEFTDLDRNHKKSVIVLSVHVNYRRSRGSPGSRMVRSLCASLRLAAASLQRGREARRRQQLLEFRPAASLAGAGLALDEPRGRDPCPGCS